MQYRESDKILFPTFPIVGFDFGAVETVFQPHQNRNKTAPMLWCNGCFNYMKSIKITSFCWFGISWDGNVNLVKNCCVYFKRYRIRLNFHVEVLIQPRCYVRNCVHNHFSCSWQNCIKQKIRFLWDIVWICVRSLLTSCYFIWHFHGRVALSR